MSFNASDFGFSIAGQYPASTRCIACGSLQLNCCDGEIEPDISIHNEPWTLARSLGFDDQEDFDNYCDEQDRANRV